MEDPIERESINADNTLNYPRRSNRGGTTGRVLAEEDRRAEAVV